MKRFAKYCRSIIGKAPRQVYYSAIVFAPSKSIIRQDFLKKEPPLELPIHPGQDEWTALLSVLEGNYQDIEALTFSKSSKLLASGGRDKTIKIWDTATATHLHTFKGHTMDVLAIAFSPDGKQLVSASKDGAVKLWDIGLGEAIDMLSPSEDIHPIRCAAISHTCTLLATGSFDGIIRVWYMATREDIQKPIQMKISQEASHGFVAAITFSPIAEIIACIQQDGEVSLWKTKTKTLERMWSHSDRTVSNAIRTISFSSNGQTLAVTRGRGAELFNVADGEIRVPINPLPKDHYSVQRVAYSLYNPDLLALTRREQTIELWNTAVGPPALLTALKIPPHCSSILLLEDDKLIAAVASKAHSIHLFETDPGSSPDLAYGHETRVRAVKVSPTSNMVASADHETVILWMSMVVPQGQKNLVLLLQLSET